MKSGSHLPRCENRGKAILMNLIDFASPITGADKTKRAAKAWLRALEATAPIAAHPTRVLPTVINDLAEIHGDSPALLSNGENLTYRELAGRSNQYSRWGIEQGIAKGDVVCL